MLDARPNVTRTIGWPVYFIAVLLVCLPALDYVTNIWPFALGSLEWRYGSVGLLSGFFLTPLLALLLAHVAAVALADRPALWVLLVVNAAGALFLLILTGLFALDTVQLRAGVAEESLLTFRIGATKAMIKEVCGVIALAWLGFAEWRALGGKKEKRSEAPDVIARRH
jgi:hypothetical protein